MQYWKFTAIERLRDYEAIKASIQNLADEIATIESEARSIKSATTDGVAVAGGGSGREERLLSSIVKREELAELLFRAKKTVRRVERGMEVLNEEEKHILNVMYIRPENPHPVEQLRMEYHYEENKSVYRKVDKAILHFTKAMYGCTES